MEPRDRSKSADAVETAMDIARGHSTDSWADMTRRMPDRIKGWIATVRYNTGEFPVPAVTEKRQGSA